MHITCWNNSPKALPPESDNKPQMNKDQLKKLERDLWAAADKLRANSDFKASEYDRATLKQKCDRVFDLAVDYANHHRRWAA